MSRKLYSLSFNIIDSLKIVDAYYENGGDVNKPLPYDVRKSIYTGDLMDAITAGKISSLQNFGITFTTTMRTPDGSQQICEETRIKLNCKMTLAEFLDGNTADWEGATRHWLNLMDNDFAEYDTIDAIALVRCLAEDRGNVCQKYQQKRKKKR